MSRPLLHILIVTPNDISPWLILSHYCLSLCPYFIYISKENTNIKLFSVYCFELTCALACAGQAIFARGMMRVQVDCQKTALTKFFLVLNLFYSFTEGVQYFKENLNFPRFQRGSNIFQGGGVPTFSRGSKC